MERMNATIDQLAEKSAHRLAKFAEQFYQEIDPEKKMMAKRHMNIETALYKNFQLALKKLESLENCWEMDTYQKQGK